MCKSNISHPWRGVQVSQCMRVYKSLTGANKGESVMSVNNHGYPKQADNFITWVHASKIVSQAQWVMLTVLGLGQCRVWQ